MAADATLKVEVAYASRSEQVVIALAVPAGTRVSDAIDMSGIAARFSELAPQPLVVGIYGKVVAADTPLRDGDRIEIYRPLVADPKQARRRRAKAKR